MLDLATIEHSRRLRKRYLAWVHVLAAVACLMVVSQYVHIERMNHRLLLHNTVVQQLREEQKVIARAKAEIALLKRTVLRDKLTRYIRAIAPRRPARRIANAILAAAEAHDLDPLLVASVVKAESYFDPRAESETRARGLAQIVKSTAEEIGLDWHRAYDIEPNLYYGALYLRRLLNDTENDVPRALRRYNGNYDPHYPNKVLAVHARLSRD